MSGPNQYYITMARSCGSLSVCHHSLCQSILYLQPLCPKITQTSAFWRTRPSTCISHTKPTVTSLQNLHIKVLESQKLWFTKKKFQRQIWGVDTLSVMSRWKIKFVIINSTRKGKYPNWARTGNFVKMTRDQISAWLKYTDTFDWFSLLVSCK